MAAPTVIKWTDSGAPSLTRTAGSLIGVLDYCLPQRGWVKEFSGTGKAVYRAGSGERKYYRVLNDGSFYYGNNIAYQYCHAKITAYDSMTDVDTGAGQWAETYFPLSTSGTAVVRPWLCVFDEKTVLLVTIPNKTTGLTLETSNSLLQGFGETKPALTGQTARNFLAGHLSNGLIASPDSNYCPLACPGTYALNVSYGRMHCNRSLDGSRTAIPVGLTSNGGAVDVSDLRNPFGRSSSLALSYPYNGELLYGRPMLDDGIALSMGDYIPYLYYPCQKGNTFNNWGVYASGLVQFIAVRVTYLYGITLATTDASYIGAVLLNVSEDLA